MYSPLWKVTHEKPSVLCTPPCEKSPIKTHRFYVLPPLKNHPSKPVGFVYSPLWKVTHHSPSVLCTPPFEKSPITTHRFCVLLPLKNHPSQPIGFVYSSLWKIIVFGGRLFRGERLFWQIRYVYLSGARPYFMLSIFLISRIKSQNLWSEGQI